jgi:hypothetical protein
MNQLGQPGLRRGAEFPQALALVVQTCAGAADGLEHRRAVRREDAGLVVGEAAGMSDRLARLGENLDMVAVEVQGGRLADGLGRHGVLAGVVGHARPGRDHHGDLHRVGGGSDGQRTQAGALLLEADGRNHARRPARAAGVALGEPLGQLGLKVSPVVEAPALEEAALDPSDEILDGALLIARPRPAQLGGEAVVQRHLAEDGIPDDQVSFARDQPSKRTIGATAGTRSRRISSYRALLPPP